MYNKGWCMWETALGPTRSQGTEFSIWIWVVPAQPPTVLSLICSSASWIWAYFSEVDFHGTGGALEGVLRGISRFLLPSSPLQVHWLHQPQPIPPLPPILPGICLALAFRKFSNSHFQDLIIFKIIKLCWLHDAIIPWVHVKRGGLALDSGVVRS